jgi:hypothetical protein
LIVTIVEGNLQVFGGFLPWPLHHAVDIELECMSWTLDLWLQWTRLGKTSWPTNKGCEFCDQRCAHSSCGNCEKLGEKKLLNSWTWSCSFTFFHMVLWKLWGWFSFNTKWWQTLMDHLGNTLQWSRPNIVTPKGLGLIKPWYQRSYFLCFWICRCHRMLFFKLTMKSNVGSTIGTPYAMNPMTFGNLSHFHKWLHTSYQHIWNW